MSGASPPSQRIEPPSAEDLARLEGMRSWVRDHYAPHAVAQYDSVAGKVVLIETILANGWVEPSETWKLQALGIAFGDTLAQHLGLTWVMVEDQYGRDPALRDDNAANTILYPQTMISKRIEDGETVDVQQLLKGIAERVRELRSVQ